MATLFIGLATSRQLHTRMTAYTNDFSAPLNLDHNVSLSEPTLMKFTRVCDLIAPFLRVWLLCVCILRVSVRT